MREEDIAPTVEALADPAVSRMLARVPHPYTERDARAFLEVVERGRALGEAEHFVVAPRTGPDARPIGAIGLHGSADSPVAEVGYWIASAHWNRGYAREALAAVARHALFLRTPPLAALSAHAFESNPASARVLEACGFTRVEDGILVRCAATGCDETSSRFELRRET